MEEDIVKEELSKIKKITPELKQKRRKILLKNILILILIILYLGLLTFAFYKMELNSLSLYLKIISLVFLALSIYKFEQGYRKDNEGIFLTGVEILVLALITLFMTSFINFDEHIFKNIIIGIGIFAIVYYFLKTYILRRKVKKEHKKNISDIRDIVEKGDKQNA